MTRFIFSIALCWGLILLAEPALAGCTTQIVQLPDGQIRQCVTCCYGGVCNTNCT